MSVAGFNPTGLTTTDMRKTFTSALLKAAVAACAIAAWQPAHAGWEQVSSHSCTYAHFITSQGTFLLSDLDYERNGGIYYSEDQGKTWVKTEVRDYNYNRFYEADGYIWAVGASARIARSSDDGRTWEVLNYSNALKGVVDDKALSSLEAYAIVKYDGRLYIGDFAGGGVLYSEDNGESWNLTDRESMTINVGDVGEIVDAYYNLMAYKGYIYAFGAYSVHRYDPSADLWTPVDVKSNFMAVATIFNDRLVCGRSLASFDPAEDYLVWTEDGDTWKGIMAPEPRTEYGISLNIRAMYSDDKCIYTVGPDGLEKNPEQPGPEYVNAPEFHYTSDFGLSWTFVPGLPLRGFPLTLTGDDDYIYTAVYYPQPNVEESGLWRISRKELEGTGVASVEGTGFSAAVGNGVLRASAVADRMVVRNLAGVVVAEAQGVASMDVRGIEKGVYLYEVSLGSEKVAGKFVR